MPVAAVVRRIQRFFAPLRRDFWPYVVAPLLLTASVVGFADAPVSRRFAAELRRRLGIR